VEERLAHRAPATQWPACDAAGGRRQRATGATSGIERRRRVTLSGTGGLKQNRTAIEVSQIPRGV
jgi:hypothetical protein